MTPTDVTRRLKKHDLTIVHDGGRADMIAACHVGLGARMLIEFGWSKQEILDVMDKILTGRELH